MAVVAHLLPAGHNVQLADPAVLYSPTLQVEHEEACAAAYCPAVHWVGVLVVVVVQANPAGQSRHVVSPATLYFPVPHGVSAVAVHEFPAVHWVQELLPGEEL